MISTRVLVADPDDKFRDAIAGMLRQKGLIVMCAAGLDDLRVLLRDGWFHLLVLNAHMRDPNDASDTSGMAILHDEEYRGLPKFMVANHPTFAMLRDALKPSPGGDSPAVNFLEKAEGMAAIQEALEEALEKHVRINLDLQIRQKGITSLIQLAQLVEPGLPNARIAERADELESLTRSVFVRTRQFTLGRILFTRPGRVVCEVTTHADQVETLLLACSCREDEAYSTQRLVGGAIDPFDGQPAYSTAHFTLRVASPPAVPPLNTFGELYAGSGSEEAASLTGGILARTFTPWHTSQRGSEPAGGFERAARAWVGLNAEVAAARVKALCEAVSAAGVVQVEVDSRQIIFHLSESETLGFPFPAGEMLHKPLVTHALPAVWGLTHGPVAGSAILCAADGQAWLLDQSRVGMGPVLLDHAALEMVIRCEGMGRLSLAQRFHFEQLLEQNIPVEKAVAAPVELIKALSSVRCIRQAAREDPTTYAVGMFYTALAHLSNFQVHTQYTGDELVIFSHILLLAAMTGEWLAIRQRIPAQAVESLWIDPKTKEVWVEGRSIELTPQDLAILIYLYENRGQCSRQQILNALGEQADGTEAVIIEESRLNSAMSRLRLKIEPDPDTPKYLITIKGFGYRLDV